MDENRAKKILNKLPELRIGVLGDFFLDRYFEIDASISEISIETGLPAHQVTGKRLSPGAAGTVVSNLCALGVGHVFCIGAIGMDGEGYELKRALTHIGADFANLVETDSRVTPCYTKPMLQKDGNEEELSRLDIKNRTETSPEIEKQIIDRVHSMLMELDGLIIADQVQERNCGVVTDRVRDFISESAQKRPKTVMLADSRLRVAEFENIYLKPNAYEVVDAVRGGARADSEKVREFTLDEAKVCAHGLFRKTGRDVFMTAQENGVFVIGEETLHAPAVHVEGEIDPVGAGDSCAAGIVSALCAGADKREAALFGNIVASITVTKLGTTGTASPDEIVARVREGRIG